MKNPRFVPILIALVTLTVLFSPKLVRSYLAQPSGGSGSVVNARWDFSQFPVQWNLNPSAPSNVSGGNPVDVIAASFATWLSAPNTAISISRGADTQVSAPAFDGVNLICFTCTTNFSTDGTLAITFTTTANGPGADNKHGGKSSFAGQILDADILFNPAIKFTTDGSSNNDLQTVATHEIGHFLGLDHSAVVKAVMFPFAAPSEHTLSYDDVAVISTLYPKSSPDVPAGSVSGKVTMSDGSPVFGAHIFVDSTTAALPYPASIRKTPIGSLTKPDGSYQILGVPPDQYTVAAQPLDGPVTNGDIGTYAPAFGQPTVQTNFTTRWH